MSLHFWERYRRASSRFLYRLRNSVLTMNAFPRCCGIARRPSFSRRPLLLTKSQNTRAKKRELSHALSSSSIHWTSILPASSIRFTIRIAVRRVPPIHLGIDPPAGGRRHFASQRSSPISDKLLVFTSRTPEISLRRGFVWCRGCRFITTWGLIFSTFTPMFAGTPIVFMSPLSFLQRPARWMQLLGQNGLSYSCAPNFAFDLAARRTSDDDMAGLDLGDVLGSATVPKE